jgi:hypothetical protein
VDDLSRPVPVHLREVVDDPSRLEAAVLALLPPASSRLEAPTVNVAVTWERSGRVRSTHLARSTGDSTLAAAVLALVAPAVRHQPPLARPLFLQIRAMRAPGLPLLRLHSPELCVPHIRHEEGVPPRIGEGARILGGVVGYHRAGPGGEPPPFVVVRLHVSLTGELELEAVRGDAALLPRVRSALAETAMDPALLNGEPAPGSVLLTFVFPDPPRPSIPPPGAVDHPGVPYPPGPW